MFNYNYSNGKGQTKAGDTFNSSLNMGPSDTFYSSNLIKDEVVAKEGQDISAGIELDWAPVKVGTFSMRFKDAGGNVVTGISDNFGNIVFSNNPGTVAAVVSPSGSITFVGGAPTFKGDITVNYKYDNTSVRADGPQNAAFTNAPGAELQIKSVPVNAETRTMRAYWALNKRQASCYSDVA